MIRRISVLCLLVSGSYLDVFSQKMDIEGIAKKVELRLIIPDSTFNVVRFLETALNDSSILLAFDSLQLKNHDFSGYFAVSRIKWTYDMRRSVRWKGHWTASSELPIITIDSLNAIGRLRKQERKKLYAIEKWVIEAFSPYAWRTTGSISNMKGRSEKNVRVKKFISTIEQCLNGFVPGIADDSTRRYLDFLDSSSIGKYYFTVSDESFDGNWAIPYCFYLRRDPAATWKGINMAMTEYCLDREELRVIKIRGRYSQGQTTLTFRIETRLENNSVLPSMIYFEGEFPFNFWQREHFVFVMEL